MGKKSRRPGRNKPKRSKEEIFLSRLNLPFSFTGPDAPKNPRDPRQLADFCLKNFRYFDSDKQNGMRFVLFRQYTDLVLSDEGVWRSKDVRALCEIADDESELTYFRVEALIHLAYAHYHQKFDMEGRTECFMKVERLCKDATDHEKLRQLPPRIQRGSHVGEYLFHRQLQAEREINKYCNESTVPTLRSETEIVQVPRSAGNQCDNCQKTRAELGVDRFLCCSRCQFEYYCSSDCQLTAWKNGHKKRCRTKSDFRPGDQVVVKEGSKGSFVRLVSKRESEDSWVVVSLYGKNEHIVPTKELTRLRPALWQDTKTLKFIAEMSPSEKEQYMAEFRRKHDDLLDEQKKNEEKLGRLKQEKRERLDKLEQLKQALAEAEVQEAEAKARLEEAQVQVEELEQLRLQMQDKSTGCLCLIL